MYSELLAMTIANYTLMLYSYTHHDQYTIWNWLACYTLLLTNLFLSSVIHQNHLIFIENKLLKSEKVDVTT
jgi:hypothetical protein